MPPADKDRFARLLEEHQGILYKVANGHCRSRDDRADLIQEMLAQLWRAFPAFDGRVRFSTWMYRIAVNVAISAWRSESRRARGLQELDGCSHQEIGEILGITASNASTRLGRIKQRLQRDLEDAQTGERHEPRLTLR